MESNDRDESRGDDDRTGQGDTVDNTTTAGPTGASIIATNIMGANAGTGTGAIVAAGAAGAAAPVAPEPGGEDDALNLDVLEQFGSKHRETGDEGVSTQQGELEADELNG